MRPDRMPGYFDCGVAPFPSESAPKATAKPSRWARASREDLEEVMDAAYALDPNLGSRLGIALDRVLTSCPPLRTEAEVAEEALECARKIACFGATPGLLDQLRTLAKEPTR